MENTHSRLGIASFVVSLSVILLSAALMVMIAVFQARIDQGGDFAVMMVRLYGLLAAVIALLTVAGIGIGIAGVVRKAGKRTFAVAGLCILSVILCLQAVFLFSFYRERRQGGGFAGDREGLFFYSPDQKMVDDYFNLYEYLSQWEKNQRTVTDEKLAQYYRGYTRTNSLQGLLFESFLRQTKNPLVRKQVLKLIEQSRFNDQFSYSLTRLYSSKEVRTVQEGKERIVRNFRDRYFDEGINLFSHGESRLFDGKLGVLLFDNPWSVINVTSKGAADPNDLSLIVGGETNALVVMFKRFVNIPFEQFRKDRVENGYDYKTYGNWKVRQLEKRGILAKSGADRLYLGYGTGPDTIQGIERGTFTIYLYSDRRREGYEVSYLMNFSQNNNNYAVRHRIWSALLMQLNFVYIGAE
jgi:hypothetical protein